jgi:hypothetical protein
MTERRNSNERRSDPRTTVAGRIFWKRPGRKLNYVAWMSDASPSSASFITPSCAAPDVGEDLEISPAPGVPRGGRVTRTEEYDERLALIACRTA